MVPGSTVRLTVVDSARPLTGVLLFATDDAWSVALANGQVVAVDPGNVTAAEVQVVGNSLRGILIGGGIGLATGLLLVNTAIDDCSSDRSALCDLSVGAVVVGGAAAGALVGNLIASTRWVPAIAPSDGGGVSFRWTLAVRP
jgi:hypothetical protein